jgi:hypothetical protein
VDEHVWEEHCVGHAADPALGVPEVKPKQLCLLAFLPHILDSQAAGREAYLQILRGLTAKFKDRPFSYLWAEGGAQPGLEANFGVGGEQGGRVRRLGEPSPAGSSRQLGSGSVAGGWHGLAPPPGCAVCLPSTSTALAPKIALCVNLRSLAHSV